MIPTIEQTSVKFILDSVINDYIVPNSILLADNATIQEIQSRIKKKLLTYHNAFLERLFIKSFK